jgi:hypothetical protein
MREMERNSSREYILTDKGHLMTDIWIKRIHRDIFVMHNDRCGNTREHMITDIWIKRIHRDIIVMRDETTDIM